VRAFPTLSECNTFRLIIGYTLGQLWYEIFEFSCNLSPEERRSKVFAGESDQFIIAMHPHGIIPLQAILWTSYCDQYLPGMYGFGAAADAVAYVPYLRNIMDMLTAGSASYHVLKNGLLKVNLIPHQSRILSRYCL
jgi:hypothetical protein